MAVRTDTLQANIHTHDFNSLEQYSLFMGGLNVNHDSLVQYDPLKTGFGRIFMTRKPTFLDQLIPDKLKKFKHIIEYANTGVNGLNNITVDFEAIQGGYVGKQFEIPMIAKDDTNSITIKCYEFSGSPIREVLHMWVTGVLDIQSGFSHYHGVDLPVNQANHTAEFIYLNTDQSGKRIEYACFLANCFPKEIKEDHFNYDAGQHALVPLDLEFTCTKYVSPQINAVAIKLLDKYNILMNYLDYNSGFRLADVDNMPAPSLKADQVGLDQQW